MCATAVRRGGVFGPRYPRLCGAPCRERGWSRRLCAVARGRQRPFHRPHPAAGICRGMTRFASIAAFEAALADLGEPDAGAAAAAPVRQGQLTEPAGTLGRLEALAIFFAGWQRSEAGRGG